MDNNKKFLEGLLKADGIDPAGATKAERIAFTKMLDKHSKPKKSKPTSQPNIWRIIMKSRITKFAAAAGVVIALIFWSVMPDTLLSTAYALQDTIEAYNSIRYLHISEFETFEQERRPSELWIACDYYGRLDKIRWESPNSGGQIIGAITLVSDGSISEVWLKDHNLCFKTLGTGEAILRWDISELDPKLTFEKLREQQERGKIILEAKKPENKSNPIVVTVTYPEGSLSEAYKKVFYVDQATKLVKKIEKFQMRNREYHHMRTAEFSGYNDEIDPMMFNLDRELPEDTVYVDRSTEEIGLAQGEMSDEEVAAEVGRKFFEAIIAKDFDKAGLMWGGVPGLIINKVFMGVDAVKIISVGVSCPDPEPDSRSMIGSCKVMLVSDGQHLELDAFMIRVRRVSTQPNRWTISGLACRAQPVE